MTVRACNINHRAALSHQLSGARHDSLKSPNSYMSNDTSIMLLLQVHVLQCAVPLKMINKTERTSMHGMHVLHMCRYVHMCVSANVIQVHACIAAMLPFVSLQLFMIWHSLSEATRARKDEASD